MTDHVAEQSALGESNRPTAGWRGTCFVVMPFGRRQRHESALDYDAVFHHLLAPAAAAAGFRLIRADDLGGSGLIHGEILRAVIDADVTIFDVSSTAPNVLFELGVRQTARRSGTILIRDIEQKEIPFSISGMRVIEYRGTLRDRELESSRHLIATALRATLDKNLVDSLVHSVLPGLMVSRSPRPLLQRTDLEASLPGRNGKILGVVTGDMLNINSIDAWVNPENNLMKMGHYYESSVSALIRYFGAKRNHHGAVIEDTIYVELEKRRGSVWMVEPGAVIMTGAGALAKTNNVRQIIHVAAQIGEPGRGYVTVRNIDSCVYNALEAVDNYNESLGARLGIRRKLRSILIPLFGTRGGNREPRDTVTVLFNAARKYLTLWPRSAVDKVYFLAFSDLDYDCCLSAAERMGLSLESKSDQVET